MYTIHLLNFNYRSLTCHLCGKMNKRQIEKIHERALTFIYNDYISTYELLLIKTAASFTEGQDTEGKIIKIF